MLSFWSEVTGVVHDVSGKVHELFGGSHREAAPSQASPVTNDCTPQTSLAQAPSVEEVPVSAASRAGKRDRGEAEVSPPQISKSSRSSGDAYNLVPNYQRRPPQNSTPIAVPTYDPYKDWRLRDSEQAHNMGGPYQHHGSFRPQNTLDRPSQQSARAKQPRPQQTSANAAQQPRLDVSKSKGSNVANPLGYAHYTHSQQPPAKRRRVDLAPGSDPVDLTSDEEHTKEALDLTQGRAIPARHPGTSAASQKSATELSNKTKKRRSQDPFGNDEMNLADNGLSYSFNGAQKKSRRGTGSSRSISPNQLRHGRNSGTAQRPVVLDAEDEGVSAQVAGSQKSSRAEVSASARVLPIDLGRGLEEAEEEHRRKRHKGAQGSAEDMEQVNDVMEIAGYSKPKKPQSQTHFRPAVPGRRTITQPAVLKDPSVRDYGDVTVEEIEDDQDPVVVREPTRNPRSKTQQSLSRPRTADQSPDALTGARTVLSGNSRSTSPTKGIPVISRSEKASTGVSNVKLPASQLQPNHFTKGSKSKLSRPKDPANDIWSTIDEENRIALAAIICKGFYAINGGHILVWDSGCKSYLLADATGRIVYSPLRPEPIMLGAVAHTIKCNKESPRVVLKGSANWMSTGDILIEFADCTGSELFHTALCDRPGTKTRVVTLETLDATFEKLRDVQAGAYHAAVAQSAKQAQFDAEHAYSTQDEDRIVYEDERPPRETIVSRMKKETLSDVLLEETKRTKKHHGETTSHHFPPEPPRRSHRQSIPTARTRDPSPELVKWTEQNGIPGWAKPVVFPAQGTRQVTIDAEDLTHLDAGEFLNDNIVNYALRDIEERLPPGQKDRFHFFNTFFYTSLTAKNGRRTFNYEAVKKWTKKVDLFTKEFVVVPINLDLHWFVVIIHNLPSIHRVPLDDEVEHPAQDAGNSASERGATPPQSDGPHPRLEEMTLSDAAGLTAEEGMSEKLKLLDEHADQDEDPTRNVKPTKGKKKKPVPPVRKFQANQPRVVCLDSFGVKRSNDVRIIKEYIIAEARDKRGMEVTREQLQGINASGIPLQNNFYDCGVYLIGYMKEFAKDPDRFMERVLGREMSPSDFAAFDTTALRTQVRDDLKSYGDAADAKYRKEKKDKQAKRMARSEDPDKIPSKPASSQPLRSSPAAQKSATPTAPTNAVRGSPELPTSITFPRSPYETHASIKGDDDLELAIPHPLQASKSTHARREPPHRPNSSDVADGDDEMLDSADPPEDNPRASTYRSATPLPQQAVYGHNSGLSPLSSLAKDAVRSDSHPAASVPDVRAAVSGDGPPVKSDDDGFSISDGGEANSLAGHDQQEWNGLDDNEADHSVEIPDSQPET